MVDVIANLLAVISVLLLCAGITMPFWGPNEMEAKWMAVPIILGLIFGSIASAAGA